MDKHLARLSQGGEMQACEAVPMNAKDQLANEQKRLELRLQKVKRGQEILERNPELLELLDILGGRAF